MSMAETDLIRLMGRLEERSDAGLRAHGETNAQLAETNARLARIDARLADGDHALADLKTRLARLEAAPQPAQAPVATGPAPAAASPSPPSPPSPWEAVAKDTLRWAMLGAVAWATGTTELFFKALGGLGGIK
jgi:hypothetical protein